MDRESRIVLLRLMTAIKIMCGEIIAISNEELTDAKKDCKESVKAIESEIRTMQQIASITTVISHDVKEGTYGHSVAKLLEVTSLTIARTLYLVATKKKLQEKIATNFQRASDIMSALENH